MADHAHITSVETLEAFRASLLAYVAAAGSTLDEVGAEVMRTRIWLGEDRRRHWEREVVARRRRLQEAEAALFSARMSTLREVTHAEMAAVRRARVEVEEATVRLGRVKKWGREFDSRIGTLGRQLDSLRTVFSAEMPRAAASLNRTLELLSEYSGSPSPTAAPVERTASPIVPGENQPRREGVAP